MGKPAVFALSWLLSAYYPPIFPRFPRYVLYFFPEKRYAEQERREDHDNKVKSGEWGFEDFYIRVMRMFHGSMTEMRIVLNVTEYNNLHNLRRDLLAAEDEVFEKAYDYAKAIITKKFENPEDLAIECDKLSKRIKYENLDYAQHYIEFAEIKGEDVERNRDKILSREFYGIAKQAIEYCASDCRIQLEVPEL